MLRYTAIGLLLIACSPAPRTPYTPVSDPSGADGSALQQDCQNAQDPVSIPTVTYSTSLTTFGTTVQNLVMGAVNTGTATTNFRFYAPAASSVEVLTYAASTSAMDAPAAVAAMTRDTQSGVWYANAVNGGPGTFYRYRVNCMKTYVGGTPMKEFQRYIPDPYGRVQVGSNGHSIVADDTDNFVWGAAEPTWFSTNRPKTKDYIVYETHVGDFTGDDSCSVSSCAHDGVTSYATLASNSDRGKYKGLKNMVGYFTQLGVNAVQLMPLHEFSIDTGNPEGYSWGYLPASFFAPESSYSTTPATGTAVSELKDLVKTLHAAGIAVILDVVLTHTANYYNYLYFADPYNRTYFRLNGSTWANLGTGNWINDDKNSSPFVHKLVRDNLKYWVKDFHFDGFRFDLAVGTYKATLQDAQNELCNPTAGTCAATMADNQSTTIKYPNLWTGENWLGSTRHDWMVQSATTNAAYPNISFNTYTNTDYPGFAQWNDYFRESVKGFIQGNSDTQTTNRTRAAVYFSKSRDDGVWQAISINPVDTLNYIESHDEESVAHAVWLNQFKAAAGYGILMTSHGIPMVQQGQEFMRDKGLQDQSQTGNSIKWGQLAANRPFFHFAAYMTKLRKACPGLRHGADPTTTNSNFDVAADNQMYSLFTKSGSACSGSAYGVINGRTEFRIIANMTNYSKSFVIETGGARWCLLAQVTDTDATMATTPASFYLNGVSTVTGITDVSGYGYTTANWSVNPYTFLVLTKITGGGNCSTG